MRGGSVAILAAAAAMLGVPYRRRLDGRTAVRSDGSVELSIAPAAAPAAESIESINREMAALERATAAATQAVSQAASEVRRAFTRAHGWQRGNAPRCERSGRSIRRGWFAGEHGTPSRRSMRMRARSRGARRAAKRAGRSR